MGEQRKDISTYISANHIRSQVKIDRCVIVKFYAFLETGQYTAVVGASHRLSVSNVPPHYLKSVPFSDMRYRAKLV